MSVAQPLDEMGEESGTNGQDEDECKASLLDK